MRILYVEDNPANLFLVQRVARMGNHEVVTYTEGQPALDHFKDDKPDLVLMDIQLSGILNGLDVVKALRAAGHKTPIVAVTAYAMSGDREKCMEAGCDGYLSKPLPVGELVELFRRYEPAAAAKPVEVAAPAAPVTAPSASMTVAPEPKLDINADVKPAPAASQPAPVEPAKVEAAPIAPTTAAVPPTPVPQPKTDIPASSSTTPVPPPSDAGAVKEAADTGAAKEPVEKPAAPTVASKVESSAPAPEPVKPAASTNAVDTSASQGTSKESGEKIGLESKQS